MEQTIIMLAQEVARLKVIEAKYLELVANQEPIQVIKVKFKNPNRVAAGKRSAEIRAAKKVILEDVYTELLDQMNADSD